MTFLCLYEIANFIVLHPMLDRLLHHSHVINIRGESYQLKDRLKSGIQTVPPANVSAVEHSV
jgi:DNA replication protein DnaC